MITGECRKKWCQQINFLYIQKWVFSVKFAQECFKFITCLFFSKYLGCRLKGWMEKFPFVTLCWSCTFKDSTVETFCSGSNWINLSLFCRKNCSIKNKSKDLSALSFPSAESCSIRFTSGSIQLLFQLKFIHFSASLIYFSSRPSHSSPYYFVSRENVCYVIYCQEYPHLSTERTKQ